LTAVSLILERVVKFDPFPSSLLSQVGQRLINETWTPITPGCGGIKCITAFFELSFEVVISCYEYQNQGKQRRDGYLP